MSPSHTVGTQSLCLPVLGFHPLPISPSPWHLIIPTASTISTPMTPIPGVSEDLLSTLGAAYTTC